MAPCGHAAGPVVSHENERLSEHAQPVHFVHTPKTVRRSSLTSALLPASVIAGAVGVGWITRDPNVDTGNAITLPTTATATTPPTTTPEPMSTPTPTPTVTVA